MTDAAAPIRRVLHGRGAGLIAAGLVVHAVLIQPNHPAALSWSALATLPLELAVILLALVALPPSGVPTAIVRAAAVILLLSGTLLKTADLATFAALGRAFHPLLDLHLVASAWQLGRGAIGGALMLAAVAVAFAALLCLAGVLWWATGRWAEVGLPAAPRIAAASLAGLAGVAVLAEIGDELGHWRLPPDRPGSAFTARLQADRALDYRRAVAELGRFRARAASDDWAGVAPLLDRLAGRDVLVVFVESYGATSLRNPLYAETLRPALERIEDDLTAAGLAMRSAWLDAPITGGQSWLSHATFASGLSVDNQRSYGALLASPRKSLYHLAQRAGYRTAAVMPAIVGDWPESELMGFDRVLPAASLGYRGPPFNWVTMPDQFTLAAFDRLVRAEAGAPLMAQIALISSHAPWVPIPELVAWNDVGDGVVFERWAGDGDPPEVVWRDRDRVRAQFRKAIAYSLGVVGAYAARNAADAPLMIVLGDHQPAQFVAQTPGTSVPVHLIGPPETVAAVADWNWSEGLVPGSDAPTWPMDAFRDRFLAAFSTGRAHS